MNFQRVCCTLNGIFKWQESDGCVDANRRLGQDAAPGGEQTGKEHFDGLGSPKTGEEAGEFHRANRVGGPGFFTYFFVG